MCNRYRLTDKHGELVIKEYGSIEAYLEQLRFNIAPTQLAPVVFVENGKLVRHNLHWGFKPAWSKAPITNAMRETLEQKPTFKEAFAARRCLVPASGFYEWVDFNNARQPVLFTLADERIFYFAGLWSTKEPPGHFVIITTAANQFVRDVHHRMPLILAPKDYEAWISMEGEAYRQIGPTPEGLKTTWVCNRINNSRNDDAEAARPLTPKVQSVAGAYALPSGLPEGATVTIQGFDAGSFTVEFEGKQFRVLSANVLRNGW
jgi:putative SOS response-associated peptidase YedK